MNAQELKALQAPLKDRYRSDPGAAVVTLRAEGRLGEGLACRVDTGRALVEAGLHPATGGSGLQACSGDMLLEALVACAGVTLKAVATAMEIPLKDGKVEAEGDLDFRGTLGVAKEAPVGVALDVSRNVRCSKRPLSARSDVRRNTWGSNVRRLEHRHVPPAPGGPPPARPGRCRTAPDSTRVGRAIVRWLASAVYSPTHGPVTPKARAGPERARPVTPQRHR